MARKNKESELDYNFMYESQLTLTRAAFNDMAKAKAAIYDTMFIADNGCICFTDDPDIVKKQAEKAEKHFGESWIRLMFLKGERDRQNINKLELTYAKGKRDEQSRTEKKPEEK